MKKQTSVTLEGVDSSPERTCRVPMLKEIQERKQRCESAMELARILIEPDISWQVTQSRSHHDRDKFHKYKGSTSTEDPGDTTQSRITPETPLFLATKSGCTYIVKKILDVYPQAVEHIDEGGRNILHVAIKYRRQKIIDTVIDMVYPVKRLKGKIDKKGNSILHMVGVKAKDRKAEEDIRSPALILREDLLLSEGVKKICPTIASLQINSDGLTPEQLFIENNVKLRIEAKDWMKSTAENSSIVAVLIATVAFAAAYTVPGGPNEATGYPLLKNKPFFVVFALMDALSLAFSLTSVIIFLSILTSSFRLKDFQNSLYNKLLLGLTMLILSVSMMMLAFAATLVLTISNDQNWTNVILYMISFFPVTVFMLSYVNVYKALVKAFGKILWKVIHALLPIRDVEPPQAMLDTGLPYEAPITVFTESAMSPRI